jgi:hypothetical protein
MGRLAGNTVVGSRYFYAGLDGPEKPDQEVGTNNFSPLRANREEKKAFYP